MRVHTVTHTAAALVPKQKIHQSAAYLGSSHSGSSRVPESMQLWQSSVLPPL